MTLMLKDIAQSVGKWSLFHGDAIDILPSYVEYADFCFTSPSPYRWKDQPYGIGSEKYITDYIQNLLHVFDKVHEIITDDGNLVVHIADGYNPDIGGMLFIPERFALMMLQRGWLSKGKIIWQRPYYGNTWKEKRFRHDWEYVYIFSKNKESHFEGAGGDTSIFKFNSELGFPRDFIRLLIAYLCPERGIVLDPLCSTALTGEEALKINRRFIGIEIMEERYKIGIENLKSVGNGLSKKKEG